MYRAAEASAVTRVEQRRSGDHADAHPVDHEYRQPHDNQGDNHNCHPASFTARHVRVVDARHPGPEAIFLSS